MRFDIDQIRTILLAIADNLIPDDDGYIEPLNPVEFVQDFQDLHPVSETLYWIRKMIDCGILEPGRHYVDEPLPRIKDISLDGYKFIDSVKEPSVWETVKPKLLDMAISSIPTLVEKTISLLTLSAF